MNPKLFALIVAAICLTASVLGGFVVSRIVQPQSPSQSLGSSSDNVLPLSPTATKVFITTGDTLVVATSTGRVALELSNISGATTTAQAVYCNYGDRPSVLYEGFALFASSSKAYLLDNLYRGAIRCRAAANGAVLTVTDF